VGSANSTLIVNPIGDRGFSEFAHSLLGAAAAATELQALLRTRYPDALVRPRDLAGEHILMWYVYRDGRWSRPEQDRAEGDEGG
jgi:hypothetical protein